MPNQESEGSASSLDGGGCACGSVRGCRIEAVLSVDDRGQVLLPKDVRQKAGMRPGDKLALIGWERDGEICCIALMKVEELSRFVEGILGPLMQQERT